jgi:hypothetical protein
MDDQDLRDQDPTLQRLHRLLTSGAITQAEFDQLIGAPGRDRVAAVGEDAQAVAERGMIVGNDANGTFNTGTLIQYIEAGKQPGASADALRKAYLARLMRQCDQVSLMAGEKATVSGGMKKRHTSASSTSSIANDSSPCSATPAAARPAWCISWRWRWPASCCSHRTTTSKA